MVAIDDSRPPRSERLRRAVNEQIQRRINRVMPQHTSRKTSPPTMLGRMSKNEFQMPASNMPARPYWQGQIRSALVSIPVGIYPATESGAQIAFHQIHEPTGKRIRYEKVVPGLGPVDADDIV
ncbi:hypothetical protein OY671_009517, partial [Metschnikowia pulcherrima]